MQLTTQDLLNLSLSFGFLVLVGFLSYLCFNLVKTLKSVKKLVDDTENITKDVRMVKNQLKSGLAAGAVTLLGLLNTFLKKKGR